MLKYLLVILLALSIRVFPQSKIFVFNIDGFINQSTADYICENFNQLNKKIAASGKSVIANNQADCIIIKFNTEGGSFNAINQIAKAISASDVPVITFLLPESELILSNAMLIPISSSLIVIPPGKIIKPSNELLKFRQFIDSVKMNKSIKNFLSLLDSAATSQKRNMLFFDEPFKGKTVLTSDYANTLKLVDLLAVDQSDLMAKINEETLGGRKLKTLPASIVRVDRDMLGEAQEIINNPSLGYILLILGFYGLIWGIFNKPKIFSISSGIVLLTAAFYILYYLPINLTGCLIIASAFVILSIGVKVKSFGLLQIIGSAVLFIGSFLMIDIYQTLGVFYIPLYLIIGVTLFTLVVFITARSFS